MLQTFQIIEAGEIKLRKATMCLNLTVFLQKTTEPAHAVDSGSFAELVNEGSVTPTVFPDPSLFKHVRWLFLRAYNSIKIINSLHNCYFFTFFFGRLTMFCK